MRGYERKSVVGYVVVRIKGKTQSGWSYMND